jgi:broad specificity phosphatase PhoE
MTTILLVRHGQTAWNREERFRGRMDLPLDEMGLRQAEAVWRRVAGLWMPVAIYSSPLQRALQTAAPIARGCDLPATIHDGLQDIDFGTCAGLSGAEFQARHPGLATAWRECPHEVHFPDGETLHDVRRRVERMMNDVVSRHPDQPVVLVTHLVVCRLIVCNLLGLETSHFWQFDLGTASLSVLDVSPHARILRALNDTCHESAMAMTSWWPRRCHCSTPGRYPPGNASFPSLSRGIGDSLPASNLAPDMVESESDGAIVARCDTDSGMAFRHAPVHRRCEGVPLSSAHQPLG